MLRKIFLFIFFGIVSYIFLSCGEDKPTGGGGVGLDSIAPAQIVDLTVIDSTPNSVTLSWTAPGDDSTTGLASAYTIKYYDLLEPIVPFEDMSDVPNAPTPSASGTTEVLVIPDLLIGGFYGFAIKAIDNEGNGSEVSNFATVVLPPLYSRLDTLPVAAHPTCLAVADIDRNGTDEIIVGHKELFRIYHENGSGSYTVQKDVTVSGGIVDITPVDIDHDNDLDLAVQTFIPNTVRIFLNDGNGNYPEYLYTPYDMQALSNTVSDLNLDGEMDIAVVDFWIGEVSVLMNDGDSTFTETVYQGADRGREIMAADVNFDNYPDLIVGSEEGKCVTVYYNDQTGHFDSTQVITTGGSVYCLSVNDINNDMAPDIIAPHYSPIAGLNILLNNGFGHFALSTTLTPTVSYRRVIVADIDRDQDPDILACAGIINHSLELFINQFNGNYDQHVQLPGIFATNDIELMDLDQDNDLDLLLLTENELYLYYSDLVP